MAQGDVVSGISTVASGNTLDIKPTTTGDQWVIHNIYYNQGTVEIYLTDGTNALQFYTDTSEGGLFGATYHCTTSHYLQVKNMNSGNTIIGFDGVQTK